MNKERLYYVDWLRVFVILSLVPYHAALTYTGLGDTYIKTPIKDFKVIPFLIATIPLDNFFMTLLFFLSGIATYHALQYRSRSEYIKERVKKLLIPLILGTVLLCPVQAYFKGLNDGFEGSYFEFIPEFFSAKIVDYLGYAHLWFLLYLFIFSLICLPLFMKWKNREDKLAKITEFLCRGRNIYIPIAFIIIIETLLRPFFPGKQILIMDWANDIIYLSIFIFGFVFASDSKIHERLNALVKTSIFIVSLSLIIFIFIYYLWTILQFKAFYIGFIWAFVKGFYECYAIILLIGLGKKYFNKKNNALSYLSKASFTYYFIHFIPVSALTYLFLKLNINIYIKYLLIIFISYIFMFIVYELIVRRLKALCKNYRHSINSQI